MQAFEFALIPTVYLFDPDLTNAEIRVLGVLSCYTVEGGWSPVSVRLLARRMGITRGSLIEHLNRLEEKGKIKVRRQSGEDGRSRPNLYQIVRPVALPGGSAHPTGGVGSPDRGGRLTRQG